ncbi:hypothetical protein PSACC_03419 [Paramicrosporidium saccamoebae]|uniref:CBM21 domain-containing protein n=1 Tax=Paramicrosporidium saccamoebae TaxID=1246581 RepID=A0A2H9TFX1_9FUNG|nr:hypothetical protein PSACC_03419 [Paramicrosporidium saccamoebae]
MSKCAVSPIPPCLEPHLDAKAQQRAVSPIPPCLEPHLGAKSQQCATPPLPLCLEPHSGAKSQQRAVSPIPPCLESYSKPVQSIPLCLESHSRPTQSTLMRAEPHSKPRRRVQFATEHQKLYFHPTRPVFKTTKPVCRIALSPINCVAESGTGSWLADLQGMRQAPFCRLDYLRVKSVVDSSSTTPSVFEMDEASCDAMIEGEVAALNLDYKKEIYVHYTLDSWKTQSVTMATYTSSVSTLRIDKFRFIIPLQDSMGDFTLQIAIKYCVGGKIYWDNFNCQNYQFSGTVEEEDGQVLEELVGRNEADFDFMTEVITTAVTKPQPIPIPTTKLSCSTALSAVPSPTSIRINYSKSAADVPFVVSTKSIPGHAASWTCTKSFTVQADFSRSRTLTTMPLDGIPFFMA